MSMEPGSNRQIDPEAAAVFPDGDEEEFSLNAATTAFFKIENHMMSLGVRPVDIFKKLTTAKAISPIDLRQAMLSSSMGLTDEEATSVSASLALSAMSGMRYMHGGASMLSAQLARKPVVTFKHFKDAMNAQRRRSTLASSATEEDVLMIEEALQRLQAYVATPRLQEVFKQMGSSASNPLPVRDVVDALTQVGIGLEKEDARVLMAHFASQGKHSLTHNEFVSEVKKESQKRVWSDNPAKLQKEHMFRRLAELLGRKRMTDVFKDFDVDKSGALSEQELAAAIEDLGVGLNQKQCRMVVKVMDADGNNQITYEEFVDALKAYRPGQIAVLVDAQAKMSLRKPEKGSRRPSSARLRSGSIGSKASLGLQSPRSTTPTPIQTRSPDGIDAGPWATTNEDTTHDIPMDVGPLSPHMSSPRASPVNLPLTAKNVLVKVENDDGGSVQQPYGKGALGGPVTNYLLRLGTSVSLAEADIISRTFGDGHFTFEDFCEGISARAELFARVLQDTNPDHPLAACSTGKVKKKLKKKKVSEAAPAPGPSVSARSLSPAPMRPHSHRASATPRSSSPAPRATSVSAPSLTPRKGKTSTTAAGGSSSSLTPTRRDSIRNLRSPARPRSGSGSVVIKDVYGSHMKEEDKAKVTALLDKFEQYMSEKRFRLIDIYRDFDVDNSGAIEVEEIMKLLNRVGVHASQQACKLLLKYLDADGDGHVTYKEFENVLKRRKAELNPELTNIIAADRVEFEDDESATREAFSRIMDYLNREKVRPVDFFRRFDVDRSNSMDRGELVSAFRQLGLQLTSRQSRLVLGILDSNGDGSIELKEFQEAVKLYSSDFIPPEKDAAPSVSYESNEEMYHDFLVRVKAYLDQTQSRLINVFRDFDADDSGTIDRSEFAAMCHRMKLPFSKAQRGKIAKMLSDSNDSRKSTISYKRFEGAIRGLKEKVTWTKKMGLDAKKVDAGDEITEAFKRLKEYMDKDNIRPVDMFRRFDKDHSNTLDRAEFKEAFRSLGLHFTDKQIRLIVGCIDSNSDGQIAFEEFNRTWKAYVEKKPDDSLGMPKEKHYVDDSELFEDFVVQLQNYLDSKFMRLMDLFRDYDADDSAALEPAEFRAMLKRTRIPLTNEQANRVIQILDRDGTSSIDYKELEQGLTSLKSSISWVSKVGLTQKHVIEDDQVLSEAFSRIDTYMQDNNVRPVDFFRRFDADHSGTLDRKELVKAFRSLGLELTPSQCSLVVGCMDSNADGDISLEEFIRVWNAYLDPNHSEALLPPPKQYLDEDELFLDFFHQLHTYLGAKFRTVAEMFTEYDEDNSGTIDDREFTTMLLRMRIPLTPGQRKAVARRLGPQKKSSSLFSLNIFKKDEAPGILLPQLEQHLNEFRKQEGWTLSSQKPQSPRANSRSSTPTLRHPSSSRGLNSSSSPRTAQSAGGRTPRVASKASAAKNGTQSLADETAADDQAVQDVFQMLTSFLRVNGGEVESTFNSFDSDDDTRLDRAELRDWLSGLGLGLTGRQITMVTGAIEADELGTVSFEEFQSSVMNILDLPESFAFADERELFQDVFGRMANYLEARQMTPAEVFAEFDADNNGELDSREFAALLRRMRISLAHPGQREAVFRRLDPNHDKRISLKELTVGLQEYLRDAAPREGWSLSKALSFS